MINYIKYYPSINPSINPNNRKKYIGYNSKTPAEATNDFKKDYYKGLSNSFFGEALEDVRNRIRVEFIKSADEEKILKDESRLDFNGINKNYNEYDSYI